MNTKTIDTLVIGAGQAGIAMSEHLKHHKVPHLVLEKQDIAYRWRTGRWDSLVANGPAWHDRFPNMEFSHVGGDEFPTKEQVADYFVAYAKMIDAPIQTGVEVTQVTPNKDQAGFLVSTSAGDIYAKRVVTATGPFQTPVLPAIAPKQPSYNQLHSAHYFNPQQLPEGGVLVIGAGSSGVQIADELNRAGKKVYLSIGAHDRLPRMYRGRDFVWWLGVLGLWDWEQAEPGKEHVTIAVSGAYGGQTIDFRRLAQEGITLVGQTKTCSDTHITFADNLLQLIQAGDDYYHTMLDVADKYVQDNHLDLPEDPNARTIYLQPDCLRYPITELNPQQDNITSVIWATGYSSDFSWLKVDAFDEQGKPKHQRGVAKQSGIYFVGLPWLSRRGSSFIWGVWHDAKHIADHIASRRVYESYEPF